MGNYCACYFFPPFLRKDWENRAQRLIWQKKLTKEVLLCYPMVEWWGYMLVPALFLSTGCGEAGSPNTKMYLTPNGSICWSILIANARSGILWRTRQLNVSTVTSLSVPPNFRLSVGLTAAHLRRLAGSEALSAEDAVSLSLPYSAEMLWQSISQGDAVSMATPHCKISKLDFFFFFWEVQEQGRNEAICQRARLEKRKPCPLILQPWLLCVLISECYYGREHGLLTLLWVFEGFFLFVSLFISPIKKKKKRRLGGWEEALLEL